MLILKLVLFSLLMAFIMAKLEIEIEGKDGWAAALPTWRVKNWFTRLLWGKQEFTGYHFWVFWLIMVLLHFPFWIGLPWTLQLELQILGVFFLGVIFEDFFWFVLNPHYGIKKFTKQYAHWHKDWWGRVPSLYVKMFVMTVICFGISAVLPS
jgi:hypothetical protein